MWGAASAAFSTLCIACTLLDLARAGNDTAPSTVDLRCVRQCCLGDAIDAGDVLCQTSTANGTCETDVYRGVDPSILREFSRVWPLCENASGEETASTRAEDRSEERSLCGRGCLAGRCLASCLSFERNETRSSEGERCESVFTSFNLWGANLVIFANIVYVIPNVIVVTVFVLVPGLRSRAYDRAVICYNVAQILLNGILICFGLSVLCHVELPKAIFLPLGLSIMFLTISGVFWLFAICFDMTLAITRFRWAPSSGDGSDSRQRQEESKKFWSYVALSLVVSLLPVIVACVAELSPFVPESSPFRPNYHRFREGPNLAVIVYTITFPLLIFLTNTALFCYTSYKMILVRRSTALANASSTATSTARKRYFLFLRLYILMDAPWLTSGLGAVYPNLWLLKFLRMMQPLLMLLAILPRETLDKTFEYLRCSRRKRGERSGRNAANNANESRKESRKERQNDREQRRSCPSFVRCC